MNLMLYVSTVLIWGSTWIAIAWQLGPIPIEVSVLYRFALAALALFALLTVSGKFPRLPWAGQRYAALLGALLFSTNFLCFYHATLYIPSGLSAVIFAVQGRRPMTASIETDFPEPDSPTIASTSPASTESDTPSTALNQPEAVSNSTVRF